MSSIYTDVSDTFMRLEPIKTPNDRLKLLYVTYITYELYVS